MASSRQLCVVLGALLGAFLLILSLQTSWAWGQAPEEEETSDNVGTTGRLVVTYEKGAAEEAKDGTVGTTKIEAEGEIEAIGAEVVSLPGAEETPTGDSPEDLRRVKEKLVEEPGVATVEYDHAREASYSPGDPGLPNQWGLKKTGLRSAWDASRGDGIRIAVVDSGVTAGHPDLSGKIVAQKDFVNGDDAADDGLGHGTHVAGIAAARTGNGAGIAGGCPGCELLVAKTMQGKIGYDSDVAKGIIWAADNGADVVNLSLTGPERSNVLKRAVDYAWNKGAVVVAAAGNTGDGTVQYPGAYSNAIAVAATNRSDGRASFSTVGDWVDVAAPGVDILSTLPGGYGYMNGTSMATPHVAALAGLLADEGLSNEQIKNRILSNTTDLGPAGRDPYFGTGRIDAARALRVPAAQPPAPEPALKPEPEPAPKPELEPAPKPEPEPEPDGPVDDGGDTQRILASDKQKKSQENPAPPPPEKPEPQPAPVQKVEPPTEKPAAKPAAEEPEPVVREAPAEPTPEPAPEPEPPVAEQEAPLPQEPPRELVFQDDEELEARFRQAAQAAAPPAPEDECIPARSDTNSPGDEGEGGPAMAMVDGVLSAMRSVLEGLGLVSAAEAEQGAASPAPCAETAEIAGES